MFLYLIVSFPNISDLISVARHVSLANVQIMAGVTVDNSIIIVDSELTMYLEKEYAIIDDPLKVLISLPLNPASEAINTIAEFYSSDLFLGRNNCPTNKLNTQ